MTNRSVQIVVTPGSGAGRARSTARRLRRLLGRRRWTAEIKEFHDLAGLRQWAREVEPDFSHLACVGGDATLSAAASASIRTGVPFVPVPTGFGNVFAQVFAHSARAEGVLELLERGELRRVDVGAVGDDEIFLSHRSYGLLEQVQQVAERGRRQSKHRSLRLLSYFSVGRRFLFTEPLAGFQVDVDGTRVADDAVLVTVANVETYRGFLSLTPTASPIDGMFDVFVIPRTGKPRLAWRLLSLWLKTPGRWNGTQMFRGRTVTVTTPRRREEPRVRRRALPLLIPPGALEALKARMVEEEAAAPPAERAS